MVKIDLGAHIDGFIAVVAHTVVVGSSKDNKVKGRAADAIMAAHLASEAALRLVKPGNEVKTGVEHLQDLVFDALYFLFRPTRSQKQSRRLQSPTTASRSRACCRTSWNRTASTARRPLSR